MFEKNKEQVVEKIREFYPISDDEISNLQAFVDLLIEYNQKINLIGKSTIEDIWSRHILDSAQLLKYIDNKNQITGDFGSGAGLPGIVLSILGLKEVHLIEKSFKKCEFLQIAQDISPNKITVHQKRAEEIKNITFDLIISRAFAPMDRLLIEIKPFLKEKTIGIFLKGKNLEKELENAKIKAHFNYKTYKSITSEESNIIIVDSIPS